MHEAGVFALPPLLPRLGKKFLCVGDVPDRSVEPDIENLTLRSLDRNRNAPVKVTAHGARLQTAVNPALALAVDSTPPLLVLLKDPITQPRLVLIQRKIPVSGLFLYRLGTAELGFRIDQFLRAKRASALLALISIGVRIATLRTGADDVAVSEELSGLRIVVLLGFLGDELALVVQLAEKLGRVLLVDFRRRAAIDVEIDTQTGERIPYDLVVAVYDVLRGATLLAGLDGDRNSVLVASADVKHILPPHPEVPDIDVRRHIDPCKMADVNRPVGIRQRTRHQCSLEFLFHILEYYFSLPNLTFTAFKAFCTLSISCIISSVREASEADCASRSLSLSSLSLFSRRHCWNTRIALGT